MPRRKKTSTFLVGLFVAGGAAILAISLVWVGATKYFERGELYVTYFDESVQGLEKDSDVKYRGVKVGRVRDIRIAPDNRLIGVIMSITLRSDPAETTVAQLKITGITGIMFVNLDRRDPGDISQSPKIEFVSEHPIIPSKPSDIRQIMAALENLAQRFKDIDIRGAVDAFKDTVKDIGNVARSKEIKVTLEKMEKTMGNLEYATSRVEKSDTAGTLQDTLADARETLKDARIVVTKLTQGVEALKLARLGDNISAIARDLKGTGQNIKQASETLEMLLERLYDRPRDLFFGKPPKKRWNE